MSLGHAVFAFLVILLLCTSSASWADEDEQSRAQDEASPPSITYVGSRTSSAWIETPSGAQVAVDRGVEWKGVKVYLSLTWELVGVDIESGKALWVENVGTFWNGVGFKQVLTTDGRTTWAVELRPRALNRHGEDYRQYHNLRTGEKLAVPGATGDVPSGKPFEPRAAWLGDQNRIAKPFALVVTTKENWRRLLADLFGASPPHDFGSIDFEKSVVLVLSWGNGWNCSGIRCVAAYEDEQRILIRTRRSSYQTMDGGEKVRPWGIFVLPRRTGKAYRVEYDAQNLIAGPPIWKKRIHLPGLGEPDKELEALPEPSTVPHAGWWR